MLIRQTNGSLHSPECGEFFLNPLSPPWGEGKAEDWNVLPPPSYYLPMRYFLVFGVFLIVAGCGSGDITSPQDIVFPQTNVSFRAHVQPLFTLSCNMQGCHDAPRISNNNTDLTSWFGVRSTNVVTQAGDTACGLIRVIYGRQFHSGPININNNHREGLKKWVLEGAQNN
jgi:hypothetical protein